MWYVTLALAYFREVFLFISVVEVPVDYGISMVNIEVDFIASFCWLNEKSGESNSLESTPRDSPNSPCVTTTHQGDCPERRKLSALLDQNGYSWERAEVIAGAPGRRVQTRRRGAWERRIRRQLSGASFIIGPAACSSLTFDKLLITVEVLQLKCQFHLGLVIAPVSELSLLNLTFYYEFYRSRVWGGKNVGGKTH